MTKKFLLFLCISFVSYTKICTAETIAEAPTSGDGSSTSPYEIASLANLRWLSENNAYWGLYFTQTADIDASETSDWNDGEGFTPIGSGDSTSKYFTGKYDGAGYVITNLTINTEVYYAGLFGAINYATIKNLGLTNCSISGGKYTGGLIGSTYYFSIISNCYVAGSISGSTMVGGLVGRNNFYSEINNCYSTASVSCAENYAGGLVGYNMDYAQINNSYSIGTVSGTTTIAGLIGYNESGTTITNSYYNSETSGQTIGISNDASNEDVTGLTSEQMMTSGNFTDWDFTDTWGINEGTSYPYLKNIRNAPILFMELPSICKLNNTYSFALSTIEMDDAIVSISLAQYPEGMTLADNVISFTPTETGVFTTIIEVTDNKGITTSYTQTITITPFFGSGTESDPFQIDSFDNLNFMSNNTFCWSYNYIQTINIDATETKDLNDGIGFSPIGNSTTPFSGNYNGEGYIIDNLTINSTTSYTGLFGYTSNTTIKNLGLTNCSVSGLNNVGGVVGYAYYYSEISSCYVTGTVSGASNIGGLIGKTHFYTEINNCYSAASVTCSSSNGGGLVGYNFSESQISNSYSSGSVSGTTFLGGLIGNNSYNSTVTNCYFNSETSGRSSGIIFDYNSQSVTAMTSEEMKTSANFTDWDFTDTWEISEGITFPHLQNAEETPEIISEPATSATEDVEYTYQIQAIDLEGDVLTFSADNMPDQMSITEDGLISWTPGEGITTSGEITVTVSDGIISTNQIFTITVSPVNDAPVLEGVVTGLTMDEDNSISLSMNDVIASDVDNDISELSLVIVPSDNYTVSDLTITPDADFYGELVVPVYVTDGELESEILTLTIIVNNVPEDLTIQWESPETIIYGTALSDTQLNATTDVDGTFTYSPASGTILDAGDQTLSVTFTPTDTENYNSTSATVSINVNKATLTVTPDNQTIEEGSAIPTLSFTYSGFVNNDSEDDLYTAPTASTTATNASVAGTYDITVSGGSDTNYDFSYKSGTLTITVATGISEVSTEAIKVYPNPASEIIYIDGAEGMVKLYNITGKLILTHDLSNSNGIEISNLPKGIYILNVDGKNVKIIIGH